MEADDELRELHQLRAAMDICNRRLASVLHDRAKLCRTIGSWKRQRGMVMPDAWREAAMLVHVGELASAEGFDMHALQRIFAQVFTESRALVERG